MHPKSSFWDKKYFFCGGPSPPPPHQTLLDAYRPLLTEILNAPLVKTVRSWSGNYKFLMQFFFSSSDHMSSCSSSPCRQLCHTPASGNSHPRTYSPLALLIHMGGRHLGLDNFKHNCFCRTVVCSAYVTKQKQFPLLHNVDYWRWFPSSVSDSSFFSGLLFFFFSSSVLPVRCRRLRYMDEFPPLLHVWHILLPVVHRFLFSA